MESFLAPSIGVTARARLAAFVRTLRANGFAVGLGETQDALKIMTSELALRPAYLREGFKALFCSRLEEWQRFDEIFDAFWLGRGMKVAVRASSARPDAARAELRDGFPAVAAAADRATVESEGEGEAEGLPGEGRARGATSA